MTEKEKEEEKKEKEEATIHIDLGLGKLFKGLGNFIDLVADMAEKGEEFREQTKEFRGKGPLKDIRGVYGFSVRTGLGGRAMVEPFGNVKSTPKGPVVEETREPMVDVFEEEDAVQVVAEMPGVEEKGINLEINGDVLNIFADTEGRKYQKEILLPFEVDAEPLSRSYKNGIFEVRLKKK